jgi:hypothetical protein
LDLTILVPDETSKNSIAEIRNAHRRWHRVLPFLSEIEIFTEEEHNRIQKNQSFRPELFKTVRDIRKILWLQQDEVDAKTEYHRHKAVRARQSLARRAGFVERSDRQLGARDLLSKLGEKLKPILRELGSDEKSPDRIEVACDHLGWNPQIDLGLSPGEAWTLLAVLPSKGLTPEAEERLATLRKREEIRAIYDRYLNYEADQIMAVFRARPQQFPWMEAWSQELRARTS